MLSVRLASLRKAKKITQQDVADYLGLTRPAYTAYERGNRQPDYSILQKLADYYDVSTDYLLGHSDHPRMTADEEFEAFTKDPELNHFFRDIEASDKQEQHELKQIWEIIKQRRSDKGE